MNLGFSNFSNNLFKLKEISKRKDPCWPALIHIFAEKVLSTISFRGCALTKNDIEIFSTSIHNNPVAETHLRVLNLSKNPLTKEGAKILITALEGNKSIEVLDLSQC